MSTRTVTLHNFRWQNVTVHYSYCQKYFHYNVDVHVLHLLTVFQLHSVLEYIQPVWSDNKFEPLNT